MYEFTLLDAFFASVIVVIALLMSFSFGYTCKMERLTKALASETAWVNMLQDSSTEALRDTAMMRNASDYALQEQARALKKAHREAMKKYKIRCNAKLARQVDLLDRPPVEHTMSIEQPALDVSYLLSK